MRQVCQHCGADTGIFTIERTLAGSKEIHSLCRDCANSIGIRNEEMLIPLSPTDLLERLYDPEGSAERDHKVCPQCGTGFVRIRHSGLAGCVYCFEVFHQEIARVLPRLSRNFTHTGSLPRRIQFFRRLFANKTDLRERLEIALRNEDYESAASLRDALGEGNHGEK